MQRNAEVGLFTKPSGLMLLFKALALLMNMKLLYTSQTISYNLLFASCYGMKSLLFE